MKGLQVTVDISLHILCLLQSMKQVVIPKKPLHQGFFYVITSFLELITLLLQTFENKINGKLFSPEPHDNNISEPPKV